jgi:hypothetical protein
VARVPVTTAGPSFIYHFNPAVDTWERLTGVPGPLFSERALTLGKGQFDFSVGYSFVNFDELNGTSLNNLRTQGLLLDVVVGDEVRVGRLPTGEELFRAPFSGSPLRTRIDLQAHLAVPTVRYGITDRWEVGLSIPLVTTSLRVRNDLARGVDASPSARVEYTTNAQGDIFVHDYVDLAGNSLDPRQIPFIRSRRPPELIRRAAGSATGVGDITLRSKYQFWQRSLVGGALGLTLQLPSGKEEDFHGTGEIHLISSLYLSQVLWERFEPRLNVGVDFNADDVDRSSFLYTVGGTVLLGTKLGLIVDFIGRNEFGRYSVKLPPEGLYEGEVPRRALSTCTTERPCFAGEDSITTRFSLFPITTERNDIVDFSFSLRYTLWESCSIFFGGIVPLNDEGFRADFIPSGGIEYTF